VAQVDLRAALLSIAPQLRIHLVAPLLMDTQEVIEAFDLLDTWEERFELVVDLGRELVAPSDAERSDTNLVAGCTTRTWLVGRLTDEAPPILQFRAEAETPLVRGLVALLLKPYEGKTPAEVLDTDPRPFIERLGLEKGLSAKRRAGMEALFEKVRQIAQRHAV
jgi:cysteine desulfuration protein SufE